MLLEPVGGDPYCLEVEQAGGGKDIKDVAPDNSSFLCTSPSEDVLHVWGGVFCI